MLDGVRGKGYYVGTYMALCALERCWWGEGEMKFFLDGDEEFPTVTSTGAEDYFGGAWAFLDRPPHALPEAQCFNTLFAGYPYRSTRDATRDRFSAGKPNPNPMLATNDDALPRHGLYRWHLPDPISFKEDLRVTFQDLGNDDIKLYEREDDISTVAYWYQSEPHAVLAPVCPQGRTACPGRVASKQANVMGRPRLTMTAGCSFVRRSHEAKSK